MAQLQQIHPSYADKFRHEEDHGAVLTPVEARSGLISGHVFTVLVSSLLLALVAGAILYVAYS